MVKVIAGSKVQIRSLIAQKAEEISASGSSILLSWSTPWEAESLVPFLYNAKGAPRIFWGSTRADVGFAGYGVAALLTAAGPKRFSKIQAKASRLFSTLTLIGENRPSSILPRLFGGFGFDPDPDPLSIWSGFGSAAFILPRYLLSRYRGDYWLTVNHQLRAEDDPDEINWLFSDQVEILKSELRDHYRETDSPPDAMGRYRSDQTIDINRWVEGVSDVLKEISSDHVRKVVLARGLRLETDRAIDPAQALMNLASRYPDCYRFLFEPVSGRAFFGATPELLVSTHGKYAETVALAGSAPRGNSESEDLELASNLLANPKERQEHQLVVDKILERLDPYAQSIETSPTPSIRKLKNIQHLETPIKFKLQSREGVLPLVELLHPTPAVGGVPLETALSIIRNTETITRGWYASPIGWLDHNGDGLFTVAIRSAVSVGHEAMLYAGAGIVGESIPENEWLETGLKFQPILDALGHSRDTHAV